MMRVLRWLGITLREWDRLPLDERDLWLEADRREQTTCPSCGGSVAECSDPEHVGYPYRRICYVAMDRAGAEGLYADLHEKAPFHDGTFTRWSGKRTRDFPYRYDEGLTIGVADTDLTPWDKFTTKADASPVPPDEDETEAGA